MNESTQGTSVPRQRMIEDMRMRKFSPKTQATYIRSVRLLAVYLGGSPDTATVEDLRNYQLHLVDQGTSPITLNATITGLKFFFDVTLDQVLLGHKKLETTALYTQVGTEILRQVIGPLEPGPRTLNARATSRPGGRGYLPRPRTGVAPASAGAFEPRPVEGHVGHRTVPQPRARRPCAALFVLCRTADRLQLVP
jgi:hypothetical protein